jgi:hypothetical protein
VLQASSDSTLSASSEGSEQVDEPSAPKLQRQRPGHKPDIQAEKIIAVLDACPNEYFRVPVLLEILEMYAGYHKPNAPTEKMRRAANLSAFLGRRCEQNSSKRGYEHSWNRLRDPNFTHGVKYLFHSKRSTLAARALKAGSMESFKVGLQQALASQEQQHAGVPTGMPLPAVLPAALPARARPLQALTKSTGPPGDKSTPGGKSTQGDAVAAVACKVEPAHFRLSKEEADDILDCFLAEDGPMNQTLPSIVSMPPAVLPASVAVATEGAPVKTDGVADCAAGGDDTAHADSIAQRAVAGVAAFCTAAAKAESCTSATARPFSMGCGFDVPAGRCGAAAPVDFRTCQGMAVCPTDGLAKPTGVVRF